MNNYFRGKKILIVGGTGTIGKQIVDDLLKCGPKVIRIFSRDEYKQFVMKNEMENQEELRFLIGDVRDYERVQRAANGVDIIIHLAAMKHVPSCEYDPFEAVKTNVLGTQNIIKAAVDNKIERVVFTSSDKAISPTNAMGATKLLAERLISAATYSQATKTIFSSVRFGNVMGSRGSVIPLFEKQILEENRVTITEPQMTRFMMTISQASRLTLKALEDAKGGETFVLKMPIIKLKDLAEVVIQEVCKKHGKSENDVRIEDIGMRPGEKMYEELMTMDESMHAYEMEDMFAILSSIFISDIEKKYYNKLKKSEVKSYSSHGELCIGKAEIRKMIISEGLI